MGELACKTKIILDGGNVVGLAEALCETTQNLSDKQVSRLTDEVAYPIINALNEAENQLVKAQKFLVDDVLGYDGPLPDFLK